MGTRLRHLTYHLWQNASGKPVELDQQRSAEDHYQNHLCDALRGAAPHVLTLRLHLFRFCDSFFADDVVYEKLFYMELEMYQFRHCRESVHRVSDEEKYLKLFAGGMKIGQFPSMNFDSFSILLRKLHSLFLYLRTWLTYHRQTRPKLPG
jgi:hypothetical protein